MGTRKEKKQLRRAGLTKLLIFYLGAAAANAAWFYYVGDPTPERALQFAKSLDSSYWLGLGFLAGIGMILHMWGGVQYAKSKGYAGILGILVSLTGFCIGLIILLLLPDHYEITTAKKRRRRIRKYV